jgi:hypothetical protein
MNERILASFYDELEKIAVDTLKLFRGVRRAKGMNMVTDAGDTVATMMMGGGMTVPKSKAVRSDLLDHRTAKARSVSEKLRAASGSKYMPKFLRKPTQAASEGIDQKLKAQREKAMELPSGMYVSPRATAATIGNGHGKTRSSQRAALAGVVGSHEIAEASVKRKDALKGFYSHLSPDVLMKEHNTLSRLEGPGADYARKSLREARRVSGEDQHIKNMLTKVYGPRAEQFTREGEKIPKAVRKHLLRRIRENPELVDQTKPKMSVSQRVEAAKRNLKRQVSSGREAYRIMKEDR